MSSHLLPGSQLLTAPTAAIVPLLPAVATAVSLVMPHAMHTSSHNRQGFQAEPHSIDSHQSLINAQHNGSTSVPQMSNESYHIRTSCGAIRCGPASRAPASSGPTGCTPTSSGPIGCASTRGPGLLPCTWRQKEQGIMCTSRGQNLCTPKGPYLAGAGLFVRVGQFAGVGHLMGVKAEKFAGAGQPMGAGQFLGAGQSLRCMSVSLKNSQIGLWLLGVKGRVTILGKQELPELLGKEEELAEKVRLRYMQLLSRYSADVDAKGPAMRQLLLVTLATATAQVFGEEVGPRAQEAILKHIADSLGGLYSLYLATAMKATVYVKAKILGFTPLGMATTTAEDIKKDLEGACECQVEVTDEPAAECTRLTAKSCMYFDILKKEGQEQLLPNFCCSHNLLWLQTYEVLGLKAKREAFRGDGVDCCCLIVKKS